MKPVWKNAFTSSKSIKKAEKSILSLKLSPEINFMKRAKKKKKIGKIL